MPIRPIARRLTLGPEVVAGIERPGGWRGHSERPPDQGQLAKLRQRDGAPDRTADGGVADDLAEHRAKGAGIMGPFPPGLLVHRVRICAGELRLLGLVARRKDLSGFYEIKYF